MLKKINTLIGGILPLITDTNPEGKRKLSIGRAPLFGVLVVMIYHYATKNVGPDAQILAFIGMAMVYNGFSKSKPANGNGGEAKTATTNPFPDGEGG